MNVAQTNSIAGLMIIRMEGWYCAKMEKKVKRKKKKAIQKSEIVLVVAVIEKYQNDCEHYYELIKKQRSVYLNRLLTKNIQSFNN